MRSLTKMLGTSIACAFGIATMFAASAAESPRAAINNGVGRASQAANIHMPTMPVAPVSATGNVSVDKQVVPVDTQPQPEPQPEPVTYDCPDGGARNSEYGVTACMDDVLACINNGALAGGLNDLFNEDMRNAIVNGMGLCSVQIDKCITSVRVDCKPVYRTMADVWVDFNSRKVQPEYYTFVLRKTGLTPNQAENTCLLLDKNTYGSSFAAVANNDKTTNEYNKNVGAYNSQQGNVLIKTNPVGATVNDGNPGVDGVRGHYARWDATTATCYLRVAAYNKDEQIKNSWLFGALGDDRMAEVWRPAGDTFSCNKDLFGFSLMNKTDTAAVVGVGGGTLVGAGIGAIAGHGKRAFDCDNKSAVKELGEQIWEQRLASTLNGFLDRSLAIRSADITSAQCEAILDLYTNYDAIKAGYKDCFGVEYINPQTQEIKVEGCKLKSLRSPDSLFGSLKCENFDGGCIDRDETEAELAALDGVFGSIDILYGEQSNIGKSLATGAAIGAGAGGVATAITAFVERSNISCRVGDGLNTVAFGKSHSIDTLKDFYVKWNLRLPDTVSPTSTVVDCNSWKSACGQYVDMNECKNVALNYKPKSNGSTTLIRSACIDSGSVCIENETVAKSYGACK